jgi:hypothetical protein
LSDVKQLSAELLAVADAGHTAQLVDSDVDQLADALALLSLTSGESAGIAEQLLDAVANVAHCSASSSPRNQSAAS